MNQILSVEKKKSGKSSGAKADIKKVIRVFCILIIVFGIGLAGKSSYAIIQNLSSNSNVAKEQKPNVNIEKDGNDVVVKVSHQREITKMSYQWNNEAEQIINGNGTGSLEARITLPIGNNTLHLAITDISGNTTSFEREYVTDAEEPQIKIALSENNSNKVKVTAKDLVALSFVTYRWDDEQEIKIEPSEESKAQIEFEIDIPKGTHTLTVNAVNSNNITKTEEQKVKGVTKPKISVEEAPGNPKYLILTITDEAGVKGAYYELNGKPLRFDFSSEKMTVFDDWWIEMQPGVNKLSIKAYNFDDVEEQKEVEYTYQP